MVISPLTFQIDAGSEPYGVKIALFEGPLDLLLFLIRKDEIDIYDIPIADIARQFLEYVEIIQGLNLEQAGDFVLMAATLMKIKSRMLLPSDAAEEEEGDPRDELVRRLLEYQQFKEVSGWLEERQEACRDIFYRGMSLDIDGIGDLSADASEMYRAVGLFDLLVAFKQAMDAALSVGVHQVERLEVTTEERIRFILDALAQQRQASFFELVLGAPRIVVVVTFIALLELIRSGRVVVRQTDLEGEIWLYRRQAEPPPDGGDAIPATGSERDG